ncbi:MAG: hypothetical protein ACI4WT_14520 [Oligosphaeraceae bacterium]
MLMVNGPLEWGMDVGREGECPVGRMTFGPCLGISAIAAGQGGEVGLWWGCPRAGYYNPEPEEFKPHFKRSFGIVGVVLEVVWRAGVRRAAAMIFESSFEMDVLDV